MKRQVFEGSFLKKTDYYIKYEDNYLMAWEDGEMQDGIDYSKYDELLKQGVSFDVVVQKMIDDFGWD